MRICRKPFIAIVVTTALISACKTTETSPIDDQPGIDKRHSAPSKVPFDEASCQDNDANCPADEYCNRFACSNVTAGSSKLVHPCKNDADCIENDNSRLLCLKGRCRGCLSADECAPGGEKAGWYCVGGHRCTQHPEKEREGINYPGRPKDIPFPKIPKKSSAL